jgi:hypothetical protein
MFPFLNHKPDTWQNFSEWVRNIKLDGILIEHDYNRDDIVIRNSKTMTIQRMSRFALEHMDPTLRRQTFLEMVANTMKNPIEIIQDQLQNSAQQVAADALQRASGWVSAPATSGVYSAPGTGGSGGIAMPVVSAGNFGNVIRGAIGAPAYVDDYYNQMQSNDKDEQLKSRLFSDGEREELRQLKQKVRNYYIKYRSTEEMVFLFNTAQIVIAGGCFASLLNGEDVKDYDVFLLDYESNRQVAQMMIDKYHTDDFDLSEGVRNNDVRIGNSNYMNNDKIEQTILFKNSRMQYITTRYKTREELVQHFDFKHCCVSYDLSNDKLFITRQVYDLIKSRTLVPNNVNNTPAQWRYEKFLSRGWTKPEIMFL